MSASSTQFTFFRMMPDPERVQRVVLAAPGPEPVREAQEVLLVDRVEDRHDRLLDDLVLQGRDAQRSLSPVRLRDVGSLGRLRSIRPLMHAAVQIGQPRLQVRLILAATSRRPLPGPRLASARRSCPGAASTVTWCSSAVNRVRFSLSCRLHAHRAARCDSPVRLCVRGGVGCSMFSLVGRLPSTRLRRRLPVVVRPLRRYYAAVRLPTDVHAGLRLIALLQPARRCSATGVDGVSRFSRVEFPGMPGVSDCAESTAGSR